ncbi:MAG: single-stranded-DNA-specific exonuclease RecJ [bacterium]|jgi:single-stranded-DNA-specific exonuclease
MRRWEIAVPPEKDVVESLCVSLGISPLLATLLVQRGYDSEYAAKRFLKPELSHLQTPFSLDGMTAAVDRLHLASQRKERVGIFGDYDVDGITSTALLMLALKARGLDVIYRLPKRLTEGYGVSQVGLSDLIQNGAKVIITVDCGISSATELQWAKNQGVDVIVCDHHLPPSVLPPAYSIINPKIESNQHVFSDLAGSAVAMKLAWALHDDLDRRWLELAALGTVADVVPLVGENRVIVAEGLKALANSSFIGLRALCEVAGLDRQTLKAGSVSFRLAPRLNATGRLGSADKGVQLLITEDKAEAYELAIELDTENRKRQQIEADVLAEAEAQVEQEADLDSDMALVVAGEGWHPGVIGIVASRLVDRWQRPALVISLSGEEGKGSGRSVAGFSLFDALGACQTHLKSFGGHRLAAGFNVEKEQLTTFRQAFINMANNALCKEDCIVSRRVDLEVPFRELDMSLAHELKLMAPFGYGNPEPVLMVRGVQAERIRQIGNQGAHLRLELTQARLMLPAVGFGLGDMATELNNSLVDVLCRPVITNWQGLSGMELHLKDVRTSSCSVELCCHLLDPAAPKVADRRGQQDSDSLFYNQWDLILKHPPQKVNALKDELANVPSEGRILLQYGEKEVAAARDLVIEQYPDRDFLAQVYLILKQGNSQGVSVNSLVQSLNPDGRNIDHKVQLALTVLTELNLVNNHMHKGQRYVCLTATAGKRKVDLKASPTFNRLQKEKAKSLSLVEFFDTASPAILTGALVRLWRKCKSLAQNRSVC